MAGLKKLFAWSNVLQRAGRDRGIELPKKSGTRLPLELMGRHSLSSEYLGDLRVSGRDGGSGYRRK